MSTEQPLFEREFATTCITLRVQYDAQTGYMLVAAVMHDADERPDRLAVLTSFSYEREGLWPARNAVLDEINNYITCEQARAERFGPF